MPCNRSHRSKVNNILKRAVNLIRENPETYTGRNQDSETSPPKWVAAIFVQLHAPTDSEASLLQTIESCHRNIKQIVVGSGGDIVAASGDALVALFTTSGTPTPYAQPAIDAAVAVMGEVTTMNKRRLAQDLAPLRVGIGVDCGKIPSTEANRHPRLATSLERYFRRARRLSDLNRQTPFPAVFISSRTLDGLTGHDSYDVQALGDVVTPDAGAPIAVHALLYDDANLQMT